MVRIKNETEPPPEDRNPPVITWIEPLPNSVLSDIVLLSFQTMDNVGVDSVRVYRNGFSPLEFYLPGHAGLDYKLDWNTQSDSDGVYILEIRAWDESGNIGFSPSLVVHVVNNPPLPDDRIPPDVWWESPAAGSTLTDTVRLQLRFFDESGVDSIVLLRDGGLVASLPPAPRGGTEGGVEYLWDTLQDSDGVHLWEARAWDTAGNTGVSAGLLVRVQNHETPPEDHTPPVITWIAPQPGSIVRDTLKLQFECVDNINIRSIIVYANGVEEIFIAPEASGQYEVTWNSWRMANGLVLLEVRAWDEAGNVGSSGPIGLTVDNHRVLWVSDEYETIQAAINVSQDGDTVRVRAGVYHEGVRFMGKEIWLDSEDGPEFTFITGESRNDGIRVSDSEIAERTTLRGFTVEGEFNGIQIRATSGLTILNCVVTGTLEKNGVACVLGTVNILNSIITNVDYGVYIDYARGRVVNTVIVNCNFGIISPDIYEQWVYYGWNLFWNNELDYSQQLIPSETDVYNDPGFAHDTYYRLLEDSPAIDAGNPSISDLDGTRSDIGIYGGPYTY
jgi:hypothetical protein